MIISAELECYWDVYDAGPAGWDAEAHSYSGEVIAKVRGARTRSEAETLLRCQLLEKRLAA